MLLHADNPPRHADTENNHRISCTILQRCMQCADVAWRYIVMAFPGTLLSTLGLHAVGLTFTIVNMHAVPSGKHPCEPKTLQTGTTFRCTLRGALCHGMRCGIAVHEQGMHAKSCTCISTGVNAALFLWPLINMYGYERE